MTVDFERLEKIILGDEGFSFHGSPDERLAAARALENEGLLGLGVIGSYHMARGHFGVKEPSLEMDVVLEKTRLKILARYPEVKTNDAFIRKVAEEALGYAPKDDEVLPKDKYQRIYSTVHTVILPAMMMGRFDGAPWAVSAPEYTVKRILTGLENISRTFK